MVLSCVHFVFFIVICYLKYLQVHGCSAVYLECLMTNFRGNICNPVPWGECQELTSRTRSSGWAWALADCNTSCTVTCLKSWITIFCPSFPILYSCCTPLHSWEPVGLVVLRKIEDKPTNFVSSSFGIHNVQRIRREWCLLNWIICFGLKGTKLFLELYLSCELSEVFWSSAQQE